MVSYNSIIFNKETKCFERIYVIDPEECHVEELFALRCELSEKILRKEITLKKLSKMKDAPKVVLDFEKRLISDAKETLKQLDKYIFDKSLKAPAKTGGEFMSKDK